MQNIISRRVSLLFQNVRNFNPLYLPFHPKLYNQYLFQNLHFFYDFYKRNLGHPLQGNGNCFFYYSIRTMNYEIPQLVKLESNLVLSTGLIMRIGMVTIKIKMWKLTFRALALCRSEWRRANAQNISFRISLQFTLSTQLIKPNYLVILPPMQHHNFFGNLPPL